MNPFCSPTLHRFQLHRLLTIIIPGFSTEAGCFLMKCFWPRNLLSSWCFVPHITVTPPTSHLNNWWITRYNHPMVGDIFQAHCTVASDYSDPKRRKESSPISYQCLWARLQAQKSSRHKLFMQVGIYSCSISRHRTSQTVFLRRKQQNGFTSF